MEELFINSGESVQLEWLTNLKTNSHFKALRNGAKKFASKVIA